jgi:hypothetical protein
VLRLRVNPAAFVLTQPGADLSQFAFELGDRRAGAAPQCRLTLGAGGLVALSRLRAAAGFAPLLLGFVEISARE